VTHQDSTARRDPAAGCPAARRPAGHSGASEPRTGRGDAVALAGAGLAARAESLRRWLLAILGLICVALAAIGVFVPGLPTTVFLIAAAWLFTRSCPWLEERLVRARIFAPFQPYLQPGARMPRRARVTALVAMWVAITASVLLIGRGEPATALLWATRGLVMAAGVVGTVVILRVGRGRAG